MVLNKKNIEHLTYDTKNKVSRYDIINWIVNTCLEPEIIKKETIIKTFKQCGISNNLNGSEDNEILSFEKEK